MAILPNTKHRHDSYRLDCDHAPALSRNHRRTKPDFPPRPNRTLRGIKVMEDMAPVRSSMSTSGASFGFALGASFGLAFISVPALTTLTFGGVLSSSSSSSSLSSPSSSSSSLSLVAGLVAAAAGGGDVPVPVMLILAALRRIMSFLVVTVLVDDCRRWWWWWCDLRPSSINSDCRPSMPYCVMEKKKLRGKLCLSIRCRRRLSDEPHLRSQPSTKQAYYEGG